MFFLFSLDRSEVIRYTVVEIGRSKRHPGRRKDFLDAESLRNRFFIVICRHPATVLSYKCVAFSLSPRKSCFIFAERFRHNTGFSSFCLNFLCCFREKSPIFRQEKQKYLLTFVQKDSIMQKSATPLDGCYENI